MKTGFFEEAPGVKSMTRLMSFILMVGGLAVVTAGIILKFEGTAAVAGALVGTGAAEKIISKFAENRREVAGD